MTQIIDGELRYIDETKNANGGTELMARRMVRDIDPNLLKGVQIIHSRVRELEPDMKRILVCHDLANDPEVAKLADPTYRENFDKIVFVSHWQQHTYNMVLGVPFAESEVIPNAIELPTKIEPYKKGHPIRLIYHTTPHRGLELLVPAFQELRRYFDVELDVFSSFKAYGWELRDEQYRKLLDKLDNMDGVFNHGFQKNDDIRRCLAKSHVFGYPSIWTETSCLALIEAMCFGLFAVHSNLGALPETSRGLTTTYMFNEKSGDHLNAFYAHLHAQVKGIHEASEDQVNHARTNLAMIAGNHYDWNSIVPKWEQLLKSVKGK